MRIRGPIQKGVAFLDSQWTGPGFFKSYQIMFVSFSLCDMMHVLGLELISLCKISKELCIILCGEFKTHMFTSSSDSGNNTSIKHKVYLLSLWWAGENAIFDKFEFVPGASDSLYWMCSQPRMLLSIYTMMECLQRRSHRSGIKSYASSLAPLLGH